MPVNPLLTGRTILTTAVAAGLLVGVAAVARMFTQSLSVTTTSRRAQEVHVPVEDIAETTIREVQWRGWRVVILRNDAIRPFLLLRDPTRGVYLMPDGSWRRASIPCATIEFANGVLRCNDPDVHMTFAWQADGASLSPYQPALESPPYVIENGVLIIGREAED